MIDLIQHTACVHEWSVQMWQAEVGKIYDFESILWTQKHEFVFAHTASNIVIMNLVLKLAQPWPDKKKHRTLPSENCG